METKIVQVILLGLLFHKVAATEIFPSEELGDFIIGKDATHPALVPEIPPKYWKKGSWKLKTRSLMTGIIYWEE